MDGRGGARPGAGRKRKADEEKVRRLGESAIIETYGSLLDYYKHIAKESKTSFPHLRLLQEYVFGKPKEVVILDDSIDDDWDLSECTDNELEVLAKIHERQHTSTSDKSD